MLRYLTYYGSLEATALDERRVRGLSDMALCGALNRAVEGDLFLLAEAQQRATLSFDRICGWRPMAAATRGVAV